MYQATTDLAGEVCFRPNFWQTRARINHLIDEYLSYQILSDRLEDLPQQFVNPQPRQWSTINWQDINAEQVIGIDLDIFLGIIKGALNTEAPIRKYTQTSRQYLEPIHFCMAQFVGGKIGVDGKIVELGLWEKEERQHTPALSKIYQRLTSEIVKFQPKTVKCYQAGKNPYHDLYQHGIHRVATEYGATCLYIWLMSHTTGTIQQILAELLQDEINHLSKFWGMGMWLYPNSAEQLCKYLLSQIHTILPISYGIDSKSQSNLKFTFQHMMFILGWQSWPILSKGELIYTFIWVLKRMCYWSSQLTPEYLQSCCATSEFFEHDDFQYEYFKTSIS